MSAAGSAAASSVPAAVVVDVAAEPDNVVPRLDDEDEEMLPELVDRGSLQAVDEEVWRSPSAVLGLMTLTMNRRRRMLTT